MKTPHPDPKNFQGKINGSETGLYLLSNNNGISMTICNYGGRIVSLHTPDKNGIMADIVLGFNSLDEYLNASESYHGAIVGRYANRIGKGRFELNGTIYQLAQNIPPHHLHGGPGGFHNVVWKVIKHSSTELELEYLSKDMEEGFPGNLLTRVKYELNNNNEILLTFRAHTDKKTVLNLTNHAYFNLAGEGSGTIYEHEVMINSSAITEVDSLSIPTGRLYKVESTPFDFRKSKSIGRDLKVENEQLRYGNGYDHNYVLDNPTPGSMILAAVASEPVSGRKLEVFTTEPAMQLYISSHYDGSDKGKSGLPYVFRGAIALETQHYPDSPNHPGFPTTVLYPGQEFFSQTIFKVGVV